MFIMRLAGSTLFGLGLIMMFTSISSGGPTAATAVKIGTNGPLAPGPKGEAAESALREFLKNEGQLEGELVKTDSWRHLADQLANKQIQVGVFQGHEFAWAKQKQPGLKPLVLAVRGPRYPVIHSVVNDNDSAANWDALRGKAIVIPTGIANLKLYVSQRTSADLKTANYFSKVLDAPTSEEALDDVVDGKAAVTVVDRAALDMFKRRKPGRFARLKELDHSVPVLPPVIAYVEGNFDEATRTKFQSIMTSAHKGDRGKSLLNAFKLTSFDAAPSDFEAVVQSTLQEFPVPPQPK